MIIDGIYFEAAVSEIVCTDTHYIMRMLDKFSLLFLFLVCLSMFVMSHFLYTDYKCSVYNQNLHPKRSTLDTCLPKDTVVQSRGSPIRELH